MNLLKMMLIVITHFINKNVIMYCTRNYYSFLNYYGEMFSFLQSDANNLRDYPLGSKNRQRN